MQPASVPTIELDHAHYIRTIMRTPCAVQLELRGNLWVYVLLLKRAMHCNPAESVTQHARKTYIKEVPSVRVKEREEAQSPPPPPPPSPPGSTYPYIICTLPTDETLHMYVHNGFMCKALALLAQQY